MRIRVYHDCPSAQHAWDILRDVSVFFRFVSPSPSVVFLRFSSYSLCLLVCSLLFFVVLFFFFCTSHFHRFKDNVLLVSSCVVSFFLYRSACLSLFLCWSALLSIFPYAECSCTHLSLSLSLSLSMFLLLVQSICASLFLFAFASAPCASALVHVIFSRVVSAVAFSRDPSFTLSLCLHDVFRVIFCSWLSHQRSRV